MQVKTLLFTAVGMSSVLAGPVLKAPGHNKAILTKRAEDGGPPGYPTYNSASPTTSASSSTVPSNTGLPPCMQNGQVVPPKPLLEPWCSASNEHFHCQYCSHTLDYPTSHNGSLHEGVTNQDFEIWTVKETVGAVTRVVKELKQSPSTYKARSHAEDAGISPNTTLYLVCGSNYSAGLACSRSFFFCAGDSQLMWRKTSPLEEGCDPRACECTEDRPAWWPQDKETVEGITRVVKEGSSIQARDSNDLCCFTNGLQTFGCYLCNKDPPAGVTGMRSRWAQKESLGNGTYRYQMVHDSTTGSGNEDTLVDKCCFDIGILPICFNCPSATSATAVSPPVATANKLTARDSNGLCCFTNGLQVFDCYLCHDTPDEAETGSGKVSVLKQGRPVERNVFEYNMVANANDVEARDSRTKCCNIENHHLPFCYECSSVEGTSTSTNTNTKTKRQAPTTTKVPATAVQPKPALSFPATLPDLPQITPMASASIEKRSEHAKCCVHYGVVISCHNCSPEEAALFKADVDGSVTTKVPASVSKPMPSLSFPSTLPNLPQITPVVGAGVEERSEQEKCCVHYGVVISCHNCSPEELEVHKSEEIESDSINRSITRREEQDRCCITSGVVLICHDCPADEAELFEPATINSERSEQSIERRKEADKCCITSGVVLICHDCPTGSVDATAHEAPSSTLAFDFYKHKDPRPPQLESTYVDHE
ncbi:hypothetical protein PMZ80_002252 [Knufia obscura]|uniref:C2H2-type domain-containing protein n=1 Tax=Knufia obscura TaxID=1635080 RepID=A0ABR0RXR1_9EURO|nr:hypothetical protein PMZ80_002252 [Knufia obscura]